MLVLYFSLFYLCVISAGYAEDITQTETTQTEIKQKMYYDDYKKGWYWYEKITKEPKEQEKKESKKAERKLPSLKEYTKESLWNMHPDDFQAVLTEFHKKAVMKPTEENMYEYLIVYDIARRKALAVTNVQMAMIQKHPEFDVGNEYPVATPGRSAYVRQTMSEVKDKISSGRDDYGLIYFYSDGCEFCKEQSNILKYFIERYGWEVKNINIQENSAMAARFNVERVPHIMLIYRKSSDYLPVSAGVISLTEMEEKVYRGMKLLAGEITLQEYSTYDFQKGGSFDTTSPHN